MLTFLIILLFFIGFYAGARRGLILQMIYTVGYTLSFISALINYRNVASKIELYVPYPSPSVDSKMVFFDASVLLKLDQAFYAGVSFLLILFIGYLVTKFIGILCYKLTFFPLVKEVNIVGGGIMNFLMVYIAMTLILYVLAMIPLDIIQHLFEKSTLASFMVEKTPILSKSLYRWWVTSVVH